LVVGESEGREIAPVFAHDHAPVERREGALAAILARA
jgi:hypothetical protein